MTNAYDTKEEWLFDYILPREQLGIHDIIYTKDCYSDL